MYLKHEPLFPFGHGLTYTTFTYSGLKTSRKTIGPDETLNVTFDLSNSGDYDSDEVTQLYVTFPGSKVERPPKALKGFSRVFVKKGESKRVTIPLRGSDLMYWNTTEENWSLEQGKVGIMVGSSSADIRLEGSVTASGRK